MTSIQSDQLIHRPSRNGLWKANEAQEMPGRFAFDLSATSNPPRFGPRGIFSHSGTFSQLPAFSLFFFPGLLWLLNQVHSPSPLAAALAVAVCFYVDAAAAAVVVPATATFQVVVAQVEAAAAAAPASPFYTGKNIDLCNKC